MSTDTQRKEQIASINPSSTAAKTLSSFYFSCSFASLALKSSIILSSSQDAVFLQLERPVQRCKYAFTLGKSSWQKSQFFISLHPTRAKYKRGAKATSQAQGSCPPTKGCESPTASLICFNSASSASLPLLVERNSQKAAQIFLPLQNFPEKQMEGKQ
jgi:hypothetical protein